MSIDLYTGTTGSGKSLHAAADIRECLIARRREIPVIANFRLSPDAPVLKPYNFHYIPNEDMSAGRLIDFANDFWDRSGVRFREDYLQLYLDEAQLLFNSRRWSDRSRMQYLEFLSQSRKYGYHVVLITQHAKMIDNQFRMLVDLEHNHRRVSRMGPAGMLVSAPFAGRLFMVVRYLFQANERLGMSMRVFRRADAAMYDSYATFKRQDK